MHRFSPHGKIYHNILSLQVLIQASLAVLAHLTVYTYPQHNTKADGQIWSPHDVDPFIVGCA